MIASGAPQQVAPFGRRHLLIHPGSDFFPTCEGTPPASAISRSASDKLADALKGTSLNDKKTEWWQLQSRDAKRGVMDELYTSGSTLVWSQGDGAGTSHLVKSFTFEAGFKQVIWCPSFSTSHKPDPTKDSNDPQDKNEILEGICVLDGSNIYVMSPSGPTFTTALPFQVERAWSCQLGLLLQRKAGSLQNDDIQFIRCEWEPFPLLFNLLHPLDEITPVVTQSQKLGYLTDPDEDVIFCSREPSLLVTYNTKENFHSIWHLRDTTEQEKEFPATQMENVGSFHHQWQTNVPNYSSSFHPVLQSPLAGGSHGWTPNYFSPSMPANISSPAHFLSRMATPARDSPSHHTPLRRIPPISRRVSLASFSGGAGGSKDRFSTPAVKDILSPMLTRSTTLNESTIMSCPDIVPLTPDVCLQHLFTDKSPGTCQAKKVFFQKDLSGQKYLCLFLQEQKQIRLIKFDESSDEHRYILGCVSVIPARDAEPVESLDMIFTIDDNYTFTLYSGTVKMCKVHVPGALGVGDVPMSMPALPGPWGPSSMVLLGTPRRSSMLPSCASSTLKPKFEEELLSPVVGTTDYEVSEDSFSHDSSLCLSGNVISLRDGIHNHVTLETITGENFRVVLPQLASSDIVLKLLLAMKSVLPKDASVQLLSKWYAVRNAPGSCDPSATAELSSFLHCLLTLMGLEQPVDEEERADNGSSSHEKEWPYSPVALKKFKNSDQGTEEDWLYLLGSDCGEIGRRESALLGLEFAQSSVHSPSHSESMETNSHMAIETHALLHSYLPTIIYTLHLLYEDCKLCLLQWNLLPLLAKPLSLMAGLLGLSEYQDHYWRDFPEVVSVFKNQVPDDTCRGSWQLPSFVPPSAPSIFLWLQNLLAGKPQDPFPHLPAVTNNIRNIVLCFAFLRDGMQESLQWEKYLLRIVSPGQRVQEEFEDLLGKLKSYSKYTSAEKAVLFISDLGISIEDLENFPVGVALPIQDILFNCRQSPPPDWPSSAHILTRRRELCALLDPSECPVQKTFIPSGSQISSSTFSSLCKKIANREEDDGVDQLDYEALRLRFSQDQRIQEVYRLLQSSKPAKITLQQRPEVSDHEFIEEQERHLYSLCIRTMALPPGRGMLTLRTCGPVSTEMLPVPRLCLMGVAPPRNTTVELSHIDVPANMSTWPLFHNGVAAGLRVLPCVSQIDSNWIVYNKPRSNAATSADALTEHAGFLMGLGLNGHLAKLSTMSLHDYLTKGHELTSVGIILGLAASKLGSMDVSTTKMMSIHLEALLPPTSTELDVPPMVQTASILGVGLLFCGSVHRHMAEVLMGEIGRPPGPEMEHCVDRESYALAAGLALGLVTFGRGTEVAALADLPMADQLYHFMVGGHKRPLVGIHKEKQKSPSYQIREGDSVNVDVTSPGATLALGMMFFNTGNKAIAKWMEAPDTQYLLDMVRPDFLLLRTISHSLILWQDVLPSKAWVEAHIPQIVSIHAFKKSQNATHVDYETMSQAYCNIIAGACMSLALKFAGSANDQAFQTLMHYARMFLCLSGKAVSEQAGKSTLETCLNVSVLSLAMVMAGTGDLEVMRLCRHLRSRTSQAHSFVHYGSHLAIHMALGLLFLGGGRYTLKTTPTAIGAMICAFYPKFPTHSNDNRYHLQAFCHLYVLAVEPRLVIPRDIDTGRAVYAHLKVVFKDTPHYKGAEYLLKAPALLPELHLLKEVSVCDNRYWPIIFDNSRNWNTLKLLLERNGHLFIKQKAGCLPYTQDPKGFQSILSQHLAKVAVCGWALKPTAMTAFSCDPLVLCFLNYFLLPRAKEQNEGQFQQQLCSLLFESAVEEKMEAFPDYLHLLQDFSVVEKCFPQPLQLWQLRLILSYQHSFGASFLAEYSIFKLFLLKPDLILAVHNVLKKILNSCIEGESLKLYLNEEVHQVKQQALLVAYLTLHGIPSPEEFKKRFAGNNLASQLIRMNQNALTFSALTKLLSSM